MLHHRLVKPLALFLLFYTSAGTPPAPSEMVVHACFSPHGKCFNRIVREIRAAKTEILAAVYAFTNDELARALVRAKKRGLKVRVVLDEEFDQGSEHSRGSFLEDQGLSVRRVTGKAKGGAEKGTDASKVRRYRPPGGSHGFLHLDTIRGEL